MSYVRTVKTASGATAVQIVYSWHRGSREIEHIGSAHDNAELELLMAAARQRLAAGQDELDLGPDAAAAGPARPEGSAGGCHRPGQAGHNAFMMRTMPDGVRVAYRRQGDGPGTVLVHGGFLDSSSWTGLMEVLARTRTVVAADRRGHGGQRPLYEFVPAGR
jgi:hypothetical protein